MRTNYGGSEDPKSMLSLLVKTNRYPALPEEDLPFKPKPLKPINYGIIWV